MDVASTSRAFREFMWAPDAARAVDDYRAARSSGMYPLVRDLATVTPAMVLVLFAGKAVLERLVLRPVVGRLLRPKGQALALAFESKELDEVYVRSKPSAPDINDIKALSKAMGRPVEELNCWFRTRQARDRHAVKVRTTAESLWRLLTYSLCFFVNMALSRRQAWFKDPSLCWEGLPFQPLSADVKYFYTALEIPLYVVLLLAQLLDGRKARDSWEMVAHHLLVVLLLSAVYLGNYVRMGMLGLLLHDVTDLFLEASKLASSFRFRAVADLCFVGFAGAWAYARLYKFAAVVLLEVHTGGRAVAGPQFMALLSALLGVLLLLNLFWFSKIAKVVYRILWGGSTKESQQRDFTDLSTDEEHDSDSSYFSDGAPLKRHED